VLFRSWGGTAVASANVLIDGAITDSKIASGALTAAKFASGAFDAVWSVTTRLLTAGTNIVLAKGTGITGFNDLDASGVRAAVGLASANLDTQLGTIDSNVDAIKAKTDELTFTEAGAVDANVQSVNDTEVAGYWRPGTEWGPAPGRRPGVTRGPRRGARRGGLRKASSLSRSSSPRMRSTAPPSRSRSSPISSPTPTRSSPLTLRAWSNR